MSEFNDDNQPNTNDDICPQHGDFSVRMKSALQEVGYLFEAGLTSEEIESWVNDQQDEYIDRAFLGFVAINKTIYNEATQIRIINVLRNNKTTKADELSKEIAENFINELGYEPTPELILYATMNLAFQVALTNQSMLGGSAKGHIESMLVNNFSSSIVAVADRDKLCVSENYAVEDEYIESSVNKLLNVVRSYPGNIDVNEEFLAMKVKIALENVRILKKLIRLEDVLSKASSIGEGVTAEALSANNDNLVANIQKIKKYGVKDVSFPASDIAYEDSEIVFINPYTANLGKTKSYITRTSPLALIKIVASGTEIKSKYKFSEYENPFGTITELYMTEAYHVMTLDRSGHLYSGLNFSGLSLQKVFEYDGKLKEYENLRASVLSYLFMSIAPATIVDKMRLRAHLTKLKDDDGDDINYKGDVVYNIDLPRQIVRFFAEKPIGKLKNDFDEALKQEEEQAKVEHRNLRQHPVVGHLRRIPSGSEPSSLAIANSVQFEGEDFIIPDGYTYVKPHERGSELIGRVIGHVARLANESAS